MSPEGPETSDRIATMADLQQLQEAIGHALEAAELEALGEDPEEQHQAFAMGARERKRRRR